MSSDYQRSIDMVGQECRRLGKSNYPSAEMCEGMIQANLAHGFISQAESLELTQKALDAVAARRKVLQAENMARRLDDLNKLYGVTA